jgi:hypothetical protein
VKCLLVPGLAIFFTSWVATQGASTNFSAVADTTLFEFSPDNNLGGSTLAVGSIGATGRGARARALLRFDVQGIPSNAVIESASLTFRVIQSPFLAQPSSFDAHRFLKTWNEGGGSGSTGTAAQPGETTWNSQFHSGTAWSQPGSASGVEYIQGASGSADVSDPGVYTITGAGLAADVQSWVANPGTNHGWILISSGEGTQWTARRLASREDAINGPKLEMTYSLPPQDPVPFLASAVATNGIIELRFTVPSTYCYEVQFRDSLTGGSWFALTNICAPTTDVQGVANDIGSASQRFYRLRISDRIR